MGKIADRLQRVTDMNRASAIRNARTMTTCAENQGRMQSYQDLEREGCVIEREWIAASDGRTRHEHRVLDGQKRKEGEAFSVGGEKIMYPGDPEAAPHIVYNCRCTLGAEIVSYKGKDVRTSYYKEGKKGSGTKAFEKKLEEAEKRKEERRKMK